jgi:hypothetical protein
VGTVRGLRSVVAEHRRRAEQSVSFGGEMGLLDDAIREHMELKRLRGADPSEVARQERDALGPVVREPDAEDEGAAFEDLDGAHDGELSVDPHPARGDDLGEPERGPDPIERGPDFANVGQETAELDMRTVLDGEPDESGGFVEEAPSIPGDTPGQERLRFD